MSFNRDDTLLYAASSFREISVTSFPAFLLYLGQSTFKYHWNLSTVKKFKLNVDDLTRVVRVNMEIVSLAKLAYKISMISNDSIDNLLKSYWSGVGNIEMELPDAEVGRHNYNSGEIWEYLIEGKLVLTD